MDTATAGRYAAADLGNTLRDFRVRFNDHSRVKKLIRKWERDILLHAEDRDECYVLVVRADDLHEVKSATPDDDNDIYVLGSNEVLNRIFTGEYAPAQALLDGMVELYCSDRDKVKLEAISMVMWGLAKK